METVSALLDLCEGNPTVTGGFPSQRASNVELWCFLWCQSAQTAEQTVNRQGNQHINTLRPRQNGRHFADNNFNCIFLNENVRISIEISLKFFPKGRINNTPSLVQIMAWRRRSDKPLSEPMMVRLPTHICVARPQWVKVETKWPPSRRWHFSMHFIQWKGLHFD